jgi:hypothetical protein
LFVPLDLTRNGKEKKKEKRVKCKNAFINGRARIHGSGDERNYHADYTYSREAVEDYAHLRDGEA